MNGFGKLYYENGEIAYEGYWRDGRFSGRGKMFNNDTRELGSPFDYRDFSQLGECWVYYDGMFEDDERNGAGQIRLSNGEQFEGMFCRNLVEGAGKFWRQDGRSIEGIWKADHLLQQF